REWGQQWPSSSSFGGSRFDSAGSQARSLRRKNKRMGQNAPLSSVSRDVRGSHFWGGAITPVSASAYARSAYGFSRANEGLARQRSITPVGPPPPAGTGVRRGWGGAFFDSMSSGGSFSSSGCYPQSLGGRGGRYFGMGSGGTGKNNLDSARRRGPGSGAHTWRSQPELDRAVVDKGSHRYFSSSSSSSSSSTAGYAG
ncbi:unnamed protein product, partial [Pylaiella littoralis]